MEQQQETTTCQKSIERKFSDRNYTEMIKCNYVFTRDFKRFYRKRCILLGNCVLSVSVLRIKTVSHEANEESFSGLANDMRNG